MNQRIKELIERCGLYLAPDNPEVFEKELEFFAESIVRECASLVVDDYVILEHFGVEE